MSQRMRYFLCAFILLITASVAAADATPPALNSYAHDPSAFTQGLVWERGLLYESTGLYGHSTLSVRELKSGRILRRIDLPKAMFGEGIALVGNELFQLTWQEHQIFVYDKTSLRLKRTLPYAREGWGLTYDGRHLIASDGSAQLHFLDPATLREVRRLDVTETGQAIGQLNELEYVKGEILANIYGADRIARISPKTGKIIAWITLSHLFPRSQRPSDEAVLNGIAYDQARDVLLITGKHWPSIFVLPAP